MGEYEFKDRRQEIVFIGHRMKQDVIQELLDSCLLTDEEMALGPDGWMEKMEEFDTIKSALPEDDEDDEEDEDEEEDEEGGEGEGEEGEHEEVEADEDKFKKEKGQKVKDKENNKV